MEEFAPILRDPDPIELAEAAERGLPPPGSDQAVLGRRTACYPATMDHDAWQSIVAEHWYAYQCLRHDCPENVAGTGVVLDLRLAGPLRGPGARPPVAVACPRCGSEMDFCGSRPARPGGH